MTRSGNRWLAAALGLLIAGGGYYAWKTFKGDALPEGIASGNGRLEATEIDVSTKTPGRVEETWLKKAIS